MEPFKTIMQDVEAEIEEKKSRFIANIFYVESEEQAKEKIKLIKKQYYDARHYPFAYRLALKSGVKEKQSDDGEPSGTAGAPMLNILQKNELANVIVIVTRYFGGTLLGTGGLVKAYSEATLQALQNAQIVMQTLGESIQVVIEYKDLEKFKYYCRKHKIFIVKIMYEKNIICTIELTKEEKTRLLEEEQKEIPILGNTVLEQKYIKLNIQ